MSSRETTLPLYTMSSMVIYAIQCSPQKGLTLSEICVSLEAMFHVMAATTKLGTTRSVTPLKEHPLRQDEASQQQRQESVDRRPVPCSSHFVPEADDTYRKSQRMAKPPSSISWCSGNRASWCCVLECSFRYWTNHQCWVLSTQLRYWPHPQHVTQNVKDSHSRRLHSRWRCLFRLWFVLQCVRYHLRRGWLSLWNLLFIHGKIPRLFRCVILQRYPRIWTFHSDRFGL